MVLYDGAKLALSSAREPTSLVHNLQKTSLGTSIIALLH